ncbi:MAG: hypothetical protein JNL58_29160 [Planctomyces sp.]|nr:hypothetical protein [Planctomyces sp.]
MTQTQLSAPESLQDPIEGSSAGFNSETHSTATLIPQPRRRKVQVRAEIGITVDRTASSKSFEIGIRECIRLILENVQKRAGEVVVYLQSHGDLDEGQEIVLHSDGVSVEQACKDLAGIEFAGGGDPAEHHLDAFEALALNVPWTSDPSVARGVVIGFMTADSKKATSGRSSSQIGRLMKHTGLTTLLVCEPDCPRLARFADAAEAERIPINNSPTADDLAPIVQQIAASIAQTLNRGDTTPM